MHIGHPGQDIWWPWSLGDPEAKSGIRIVFNKILTFLNWIPLHKVLSDGELEQKPTNQKSNYNKSQASNEIFTTAHRHAHSFTCTCTATRISFYLYVCARTWSAHGQNCITSLNNCATRNAAAKAARTQEQRCPGKLFEGIANWQKTNGPAVRRQLATWTVAETSPQEPNRFLPPFRFSVLLLLHSVPGFPGHVLQMLKYWILRFSIEHFSGCVRVVWPSGVNEVGLAVLVVN